MTGTHTGPITASQIDNVLLTVQNSNLSAVHKICRTGVLVVAASDSSAKSQSQADYVCTGSSSNYIDGTVINQAMTYAVTYGLNVQLTGGKFYVDEKVDVLAGRLIGKGNDEAVGTGTNIYLGANGQINLASSYTSISDLRIIQSATATVPAITNSRQAKGISIERITITGGNSSRTDNDEETGVFAIQIEDHYELYMNNVYIRTSGNGIHFVFTGTYPNGDPAPYNTGDSYVSFTRVRLSSPNSICYLLEGSKTSTNILNDVHFYMCYGTAGDQSGWTTANCSGIFIRNCKRLSFFGFNLEEVLPAVTLEGLIGSGSTTDQINFIGGSLLSDNVILNAGCTNIKFSDSAIMGTLTGNSASISSTYMSNMRVGGSKWNNRGNTTIADTATSATVTHSLGRTPSIQDILIMPTNATAAALQYYAGNITATTFSIYVITAPGTGNTANFSWQINSQN